MAESPVPPAPLPVVSRIYRADALHYHPGRNGHAVKLLVLHNTESTGTGDAPSAAWLSTARGSGVSIHHLYGRSGTRYDIVDRVDTAYHTGAASWHTYSGLEDGVGICNLLSIGHELESSASERGKGNGYTLPQIATLAHCLATEMYSYHLDWGAVACHRDIALPPGRRHDPAGFPLDVLKTQVDAWLSFFQALTPVEIDHYCL